MKRICHIDLNQYFVQAELLRDPSLAGKPIAVGHDSKRSVVSTASYEARKYKVTSGMPISQARELCPSLIVLDGDYHYYSSLSRQFFSYLKKRYPILQQASIDECYIDMTKEIEGCDDEYDYLFDLQMSLYKATELKCSMGLSHTKFLAKMGSDMKKPLGITILRQDNLEAMLWPLPIEAMYGIGKKTAPRLRELGINTIGDLAKTKNPDVRKLLGSSFEEYQGAANGYGDDVVHYEERIPKSISAERTFAEDTVDYDELREMIKECCVDIARRLNSYNGSSRCIEVKLRTPDFVTKTKRVSLDKPVKTLDEIFTESMAFFDRVYDGSPLRLIGVGLEKLYIPEGDK